MQADPYASAQVRAFVEHDYARVVATVGVATGAPDAAEDAVQEALATMLADHHEPRNARAWVTTVAINHVRTQQRRSQAERRARDRLNTPEATDSTDITDRRVSMLSAVAKLPPKQRTTVLMHYYLDASIADIADALDVTAGTVKTQLHRGRAALAHLLEEAS